MGKKITSFILIILFGFFSCIDTIDFDIDSEAEQVVILGSITTEPGPYNVTISRSIGFYERFNAAGNRVTDANVRILSDDGQVEVLEHIGAGVYQTNPSTLRGEVGRSYTLIVTTSNGEVYQSTSELIKPTPEIDSLFFEYEEQQEINNNGVFITNKFAVVKTLTKDNPEEGDFYGWTWKGTYSYKTYPELFAIPSPDGSDDIPSPLPCSFLGCSCCTCWISTDENNDLALAHDRLTNGNSIIGDRVATIPITGRTFRDKYHVRVKQYSLSAKAFEFWNLVKDQQTEATLFATPPASIQSNVVNINNPDELVWGFFSASDVSEKSFFIDRTEIPSSIPNDTDSIKNDCRILQGSSNQPPTFWE